MTVRIVVLGPGPHQFKDSSVFIGDDLLLSEIDRMDPGLSEIEQIEEASRLTEVCRARYFSPDPRESLRGVSRNFLDGEVLGRTESWTGSEWACTCEDLTAEGKALFEEYRRQYPGAELRLLTFLNT